MNKIRHYLLLVMLLGFVAMAAACVVRGGAMVHTSPAYEPQLVEINPGIWVVENHHQSVFYNNGYYWRVHSGVWYRSHHHTSGWVLVGNHVVPRAVVRIDRPGRYVRYRGHARVRRRAIHRGKPSKSHRRGNTHDQRRPAPNTHDHRRSAPKVHDKRKKRSKKHGRR